jgi:hypothetical protein
MTSCTCIEMKDQACLKVFFGPALGYLTRVPSQGISSHRKKVNASEAMHCSFSQVPSQFSGTLVLIKKCDLVCWWRWA